MMANSPYDTLKQRAENGHTLLLDGAIGTQLQTLGVPMDNTAWAATALATHPQVVQQMHQQYLNAGADIITTNTFSSARHNLEPIGLGERTLELNRLAVTLAMQARDQHSTDRPIVIAGSVSHFGILIDGEPGLALHRHAKPDSQTEFSREQARRNIREQAECLVDAGLDLLLLESTGNMTQRRWLLEETDHLDIPRWLGYRCRLDPDGQIRVGYGSDDLFADSLTILQQQNLDGVAIFHSLVEDTTAAIPILQQHWSGLIAAYPEAGRTDYTAAHRNETEPSNIGQQALIEVFNQWIDSGVPVVGGCCGIDVEYFEGLKSTLSMLNTKAR
jgi:S-methylmethionine-dependent homocysteine/selenocysteine methylase